jgi:DUF1365 family protein
MFFLDVDRLPNAFSKIPFISVDKFNLISFHRKNYLPSKKPTSIRHEVEKHLKLHGYDNMPDKIFILTHLSYLGYCYNPVSFYYCYDNKQQLLYLLAEVNNTPWNERYVYVKQIPHQKRCLVNLDKHLHVSPFLPMDLRYTWALNIPCDTIKISMACIQDEPIFHASMKLYKKQLNFMNSLYTLLLNPIATQLVHFRIYWQALFLFIKRTPFYAHNQRSAS